MKETGPVRLAIVNDYEMVVAGLAAMLEDHRDRVHVVEINAQTAVLSNVDVVLVDTFGHLVRGGSALSDLIRDTPASVVCSRGTCPAKPSPPLRRPARRRPVQGTDGQGDHRRP